MNASSSDVSAIVTALSEPLTGELQVAPRTTRWAHLPLAVMDAVFSINAKYAAVTNVVHRYWEKAGLTQARAFDPRTDAKRPAEHTLDDFLAVVGDRSPAEVAEELFTNHQRTSTRSGILKAEAVLQHVQVLRDAGVNTLADAATLLADDARLEDVEAQLRRIKGHGQGVRLGYLWMLLGDDDTVKPDRHVLRWLNKTLGRPVSIAEARSLLSATARETGRTPWEIDHAIWERSTGRVSAATLPDAQPSAAG